jgi:hypothetical protein
LEGVFVQSGLKPPLFFDVHGNGGVHMHKQAAGGSAAKEAAESSAVASSAVQSATGSVQREDVLSGGIREGVGSAALDLGGNAGESAAERGGAASESSDAAKSTSHVTSVAGDSRTSVQICEPESGLRELRSRSRSAEKQASA